MIKKVVFFRYLPLSEKIYRDFYLQEIEESGILVEYWYLPFVINVPNNLEKFQSPCVRTINSYMLFIQAVRKEDKSSTLFVSIQSYGWDVLLLYLILTRYDCLLSVFGKNTLPPPPTSIDIFTKFRYYKFKQFIKGVGNRVAKYAKEKGFVKSYDILFIAGNNGINGYGYNTDKERNQSIHILVNSDDYDRAIEKRGKERIKEEKFIVFLDECMPLHPDISICGIKAIDANIYYKEINNFFDKVEKITNLKVVIAAHPKALIYKEYNYFGGREIIFYKTAELVRDSELVLAHDSTAIGYVVAFNKPMLSLTSDNIEKYQLSNHLNIVSNSVFLGTQLIYINSPSFDLKINDIKIQKEKYDRYKFDFLTNPETTDIQSSKLVVNGIKTL